MTELPVTLLTGVAEADKIALRDHLARTGDGKRIAVLAAAASAPAAAGLPAPRSHDDLLAEAIQAAETAQADYLLVELDACAAPSAVADAFAREEARHLRLDTTVTVVDARRFLAAFQAEGGARSVTDALIDQIEFTDVMVLAQADTVSASKRAQVMAVLRLLNPRAQLLEAEQGRVPADRVLGTGLFDAEATGEAAGWLQVLRGQAPPVAEGTGVQCFVFRARRPFHPGRFYLFLRMSWPGVLRSKGVFWLASHPDTMWVWSQVGRTREYFPGGAWLAALPREAWQNEDLPHAEIERIWDPASGDRRTEIAFIGLDVDAAALRQGIDWCLMTDEEMQGGPGLWEDDPFMATVFV